MARLIVKSEVVPGGTIEGPGSAQEYIFMLVSVCQENGQPLDKVSFDVFAMVPPHGESTTSTLIQKVHVPTWDTYKPGLHLLSLKLPSIPSGKYIFSVTVTSKVSGKRLADRGESLTTLVV